MFFSQKQGLARIKDFFFTPNDEQYTHTMHFNNFSKRVCEGIGRTLRKDESCDGSWPST